MIPARSWFPARIQDRAAWFENFEKQFAIVGPSLGFTAAEITAVTNDNAVYQFLAETTTELDAFADAVRQYRFIITESPVGQPTPAFPANPTFTLPTPAVPTGIFERLVELVRRIRVAPAYTPEIGALLGIIPTEGQTTPVEQIKPAISAGQSFGQYKFMLNVTRMGMDAFKVQIQRQGGSGQTGGGTWQDAGVGTANPFEVTVTPTTIGQPERILVRAQLLKKNEPVGQPSDPTYVTINP